MKSVFAVLVLIVLIAGVLLIMRDPETEANRTVQLFYYAPANDLDAESNIQCTEKGLVPVAYDIRAGSPDPIGETLRLLLAGAAPEGSDMRGIQKNFPLAGVTLLESALENGVLSLTFDDPEYATSGGACRAGIMRAQIDATAKQFAGVEEVRILPEDAFQP